MILKFIRGLLTGAPYYLRINRDRVSVRDVSSGASRILIEDFAGGEKIVQHVIRELFGMGPITPAPIVVVHPDFELEGGLTQIEARALREMVEGAGARKVYLHYGRPELTDQEVATLSFSEFDGMFR